MADKLKRFTPGDPGLAGRLNEILDVIEKQGEQIEGLEKALAGKADKPASRSRKTPSE